MRKVSFAAGLVIAFAAQVHAGVNIWTHHVDNNRTGANLNETQLTPANVNSTQFGKLWDYEVDSQVYAQPLVIQNVAISGKGTHNVVFVATMNNSVYAFDADNNSGANVAPLWVTNFNNPAGGVTPVPISLISFGNVDPLTNVGIMSTPVIDTATHTLYTVARTLENNNYVQRLHALDITTGNERSGSPVTITASVPGTGIDASGGVVTFNARQQAQRSALSLANGQVTIAWGSQADVDPFHGWVMKYDAATLAQIAVFCTTPNGTEGGIWQSGDGPAADAAGNLYYSVGNGVWDGTSNFGQSVLKFGPGGLMVADEFTPDYWATLNATDLDLGVSGPVLIPNTSLAFTGSKTGDVYLLNTSNLGNLVTGNIQIPQTFKAATAHIHGQPVYYNNPTLGPLFYMWSEQDYLKAYHFNGTTIDTTPVSKSSFQAPTGMPGGTATVSANNAVAGTGIVWVNIPLNADAETQTVSGILRAFDASNLTNELWNSRLNATRDDTGLYAKYVPPVVANGKVYMATFSNKLRVYGLLASQTPAPTGSLSGSKVSSSAAVNLTTLGTSDWAHWPGYIHKAGGNSQISNFAELYPLSPVTLPATYTNDARTFSWSDGTPTASGSDTSGVRVGGMSGGFQITAPADTSVRTLTVYVGGNQTSGYLRAYLSDGSAADYIDIQPSSASYFLTYTLTYNAGSAGQLLYVNWIQTSFFATASLAAATLSGGTSTPPPAPTAPTGLAASQGTSTTNVSVSWSVVSNATSYTVYRSTAQGTQGSAIGTSTTGSYTDTTAVAGNVYWYSVVATGAGGSSPVSAQVSGYVASSGSGGGGALSGTSTSSTTTVNLTTVGTTNWIHWPDLNTKATGTVQISTYSPIAGGTVQTYGNDPRALSWTDGTQLTSSSSTSGVFISGVGNGFQFTVPADATARTLNVYVGGWFSTGKFTAHLSDGSAVDYVDASHSSTSGQYDANYTLTYRAGSAGQLLTVTWQQSAGTGNVTLNGAALSTIVAAPSAPTGVTASQGTSTTMVTVGWTTVSNATSYTVYRSTAQGTQGSALGTSAGISYSDSSAVAGTVYWYSVVAVGSGGSSPASAQASGYVAAPAAPTAPTGVTASQGTSTTSVTVSWTAVSNATTYTVYRSTAQGTQGSSLGNSNTTSFADTSAVAGTVYWYSIIATGAGGSSPPSVQVSGYKAAPSAPAAPTGLAASQGTSNTSVTVTWTAVSNATSYTVYRSSAQGTQGASVGTSTTASFTDATVVAGTVYWYGVVATGAGGSSPLSAQVSGYAASASPGGGTLSGTSTGSSTTVSLTSVGTTNWIHWPDLNTKATGTVQLNTYSIVGGGNAQTYNNDPRALSWTDGTQTVSSSSTSGVFIIGIGHGFQFTVPADTNTRTLNVYVGGWSSTGKLTAHLSDGSAADFVDASHTSSNSQYDANYTLTYQAGSVGQLLTVTWVQSAGAGNVTLDGAALALGTTVAAPAAPTGVTATQGTSTSTVTVSWTAVSNATSYTVYRSTIQGTQGNALGTSASSSYADTTAAAGTVYWYSVVATGTGGSSPVSAQASGYVAAPAAPTAPIGVTASQGTSTTSVTVTWTAVNNATTYTVYRSTAQGTQGSSLGNSNTTSYVDTTAVSGTVYWYSVVAVGPGGSSPVSAQASGYVVAAGTGVGSLSGVTTNSSTAVNLTTVGATNWIHWPDLNRKATGTVQISTYSIVGGGNAQTYNNDPRTLSWTDGTQTVSSSSTSGVFIIGIGHGFQFTVPADTSTRTLNVYVGGWSSTGKLTAHLSDGSAVDYVDASHSSPNTSFDANYTLTYQAGSVGQVLTVTWQQSAGAGGNVSLSGAALH